MTYSACQFFIQTKKLDDQTFWKISEKPHLNYLFVNIIDDYRNTKIVKVIPFAGNF